MRSDEQQNRNEPRQPYQAPRIEESADFETLALACAVNADDPDCIGSGDLSTS